VVLADARGRGRGAVFRGSTTAGGAPEIEEPAMRDDRPALAEDAITTDLRDRLLLAFTELAMYAIATEEDVRVEPEQARAEIAALLRLRAPHGLGSYVFRRCADDAGPTVPLYTSGPDVDRAVVAVCTHHGLAVRPGPRAGVLLVSGRWRTDGAIQPDPVA
jgi:hypothetical protein